MPLPKRTIKVTKFEAARSQLKTAITLWFNDGDPVSILSLAHGAHEILHRIYRNRGFSDLLYDAKNIKEQYRKDFVRALKAAPSFIKHLNESPHEGEDTATEFPFGTCTLFILFSIYAVRKLDELSDEEKAFLVWCAIQEPHLFLKQSLADLVPVETVKIFDDIRNNSPKEFYDLVIQALALIRAAKRLDS
jgi:hypothetical protein